MSHSMHFTIFTLILRQFDLELDDSADPPIGLSTDVIYRRFPAIHLDQQLSIRQSLDVTAASCTVAGKRPTIMFKTQSSTKND